MSWSGHCLSNKGHALEYDYYRALFRASDEVNWTMRQRDLRILTIGLL